MANRYVYQPLNQLTSDIRVLRHLLNDGNDKLKNISACQMFRTSLDENSCESAGPDVRIHEWVDEAG
jgi:hypothetical protein